MPWTILSSTVLRAVGYDARLRQLTVRFVNGRVYRYLAVPPEIADALLASDHGSHGRYFNEVIRDGFVYEDITREHLGHR